MRALRLALVVAAAFVVGYVYGVRNMGHLYAGVLGDSAVDVGDPQPWEARRP